MSTRSPQPPSAPKSPRPAVHPRWGDRRDSKQDNPFHEGVWSTARSHDRARLADCKR